MIVISDTSPLISLMKADVLWILKPLFNEVMIPEAVFSELTNNPSFFEESKTIKSCPFIKVIKIDERDAISLLQRASGLDIGESEAIFYADKIHADALLMDELKGRQVAKSLGIYIMGTIGILLFAYDEKIITKTDVIKCLEKLKNANRHISQSLIDYAISKLT